MWGGKSNFSILHRIISFYARRVRRIFPILIVVLLTCITAGWLIMTPNEYQLLGKHIAGGSVYISNILLWKESGYFDVSSEVKPLLHLWSLGIEEQFYIIWPFVLLLLLKLTFRLDTFILLFIVASYVLNVFMVKTHATGTFYSPPTRFWELAIGGFLACIHYQGSSFWEKVALKTGAVLNTLVYADPHKGNEVKISRDLLSILGLVLILVSIIAFHTGMHFPGKKALVPTLGAFFLIAAGENAVVNKRLLSLRIMVFIGLISYPLYLWHWPLLSFARIIYGEVPPRSVRIGLILLGFLLSWITYRFIEPPLRWGKHSRIKAVCLFVTLLCIGCVGLKIYNNNGCPERIGITTEDIHRDNELNQIIAEGAKRCRQILPDYERYYANKDECIFQKENKKNTIALFGDSHSRYLSYGLLDHLNAHYPKEGLVRFSVAGTAPFINYRRRNYPYLSNGHLAHLDGYNYVFADKNIKTVIIATYPLVWYDRIRDNSIGYYNKDTELQGMQDVLDPNEIDPTILLERALRRTFDELKKHNKRVLFLIDNPDFFFDVNICAVRPYLKLLNLKYDNRCSPKRVELENNPNKVWFNSILTKVSKDYDNVTLVSAFDSLCDHEHCPIVRNGKMLYRDDDHISNEGARIISKDLIKILRLSNS